MLLLALPCAAPARASEAVLPKDEREALVLRIVTSPKDAADWGDRAEWIATSFHDLIRVKKGYPALLKGEELGLAPGSHAVVLGVCAAGETAPALALLQSLYPDASVAKVPAMTPLACAELRTRATVHTHKVLTQNGWRMAFNIYRTQPLGADSHAQRKDPPDPTSGYLKVTATLFDPSDAPKRFEDDSYPFLPDLIDQSPDVCVLALDEKKDQITVNVTCDREPLPCSGNVSRLVEKDVYRLVPPAIVVTRKELERKVEPLCD